MAPWVLSLEKGSSSTRASEGPRGWVQSLSLFFIQSLAISAISSLPSLAGSAGYKTSLAKGSTEDLGVHNSDVPRGLLCQRAGGWRGEVRAPWAVVGSDTLSNGSSAQLPRVLAGTLILEEKWIIQSCVQRSWLLQRFGYLGLTAAHFQARTCASGVTLLKHSPNP